MATLVLDGDAITYRYAAAIAPKLHRYYDLANLDADMFVASQTIDDHVASIAHKLGAKDIIFCYGDMLRDYFRKDILPSYKANRGTKPLPAIVTNLRRYTTERYQWARKAFLEADDVMGIYATMPHREEMIVVSNDKDMLTIPGYHYNFTLKQDARVIEISEEEANKNHLLQTLIGDSSDNYSGCPGIGPAKAKALLDNVEPKDMWKVILATFRARGCTSEDALVQARISKILRYEDWDRSKQQPILWSPRC